MTDAQQARLSELMRLADDYRATGGWQDRAALECRLAAVLARAPEQAGVVRDAEDAARFRRLLADPGPLWHEVCRCLGTTGGNIPDQATLIRRAIDSKGAPVDPLLGGSDA